MCWSFFITWRSCTHSWERLKMRYESLRNVSMHFKAFKLVKNAFSSSAVFSRLLFVVIFRSMNALDLDGTPAAHFNCFPSITTTFVCFPSITTTTTTTFLLFSFHRHYHHHHHHTSILFSLPLSPPHFYCKFSLYWHLHHHHHHISVVMWWWWWRENDRNVVVVAAAEKQ